MNEWIAGLISRRSIRSFRPELPPRKDLEQIIEAGLYAPSAMNRQDTAVIAVTDPEVLDRLRADNCRIGGWKEGFDPFYGAPAVLIVLAQKQWSTRVPDGSLVLGNMLLAAHALGLGGIWIHRAREEFEEEEWKNLLARIGLSGEWEGIGHCAVGYPAGDPPEASPRREGRVFWVE